MEAEIILLNNRIAEMDKRIEKEDSIELAIRLIQMRNVQIIKRNAVQSRLIHTRCEQMDYNVKILQ